jgi:hypothetical protein
MSPESSRWPLSSPMNRGEITLHQGRRKDGRRRPPETNRPSSEAKLRVRRARTNPPKTSLVLLLVCRSGKDKQRSALWGCSNAA